MLARVLSWFRPRKAQGEGTSGAAASKHPKLPARTPVTVMDVLRDQIEGGQEEVPTSLPVGVAQLAETVFARAFDTPAPPSFPAVAVRVMAIARNPSADVNQLVGTVQRDAAIAQALLRVANSAIYAGGEPVNSLRGAVQKLGMYSVIEVVMGEAGRGYYQLASKQELALFPQIWPKLADEAMANGFSAGRLGLDIPGAHSERALLGGLLADVGRPIALRVISAMILEGAPHYDDASVLATLDEIAPAIGARAISRMNLPDDVVAACACEGELDIDARVAQLIAAVGGLQRRGARVWRHANTVSTHAEKLGLKPLAVRALFAQRLAYVEQAAQMFNG